MEFAMSAAPPETHATIAVILLVLCVLGFIGVLAMRLHNDRLARQNKAKLEEVKVLHKQVSDTNDRLQERIKQQAQLQIDSLRSDIAEVKAKFADPATADLSNLEEALAAAEQQFAAGQYSRVLATTFGPLVALEQVKHDLKDRPAGQLISLKVEVKSGDQEKK